MVRAAIPMDEVQATHPQPALQLELGGQGLEVVQGGAEEQLRRSA